MGRHHITLVPVLALATLQATLVAIPMAILRLVPTNRGILPMGTLLQDPLTALRSTIKKDEKKLSVPQRQGKSESLLWAFSPHIYAIEYSLDSWGSPLPPFGAGCQNLCWLFLDMKTLAWLINSQA